MRLHMRVVTRPAIRRPRNCLPAQAMTPALTDHDIYLFREGNHGRLYDKLGSHLLPDGTARFAVWAPNARTVSVIGEFNVWDPHQNELKPRWDGSGIWEGSAEGLERGTIYKYRIV